MEKIGMISIAICDDEEFIIHDIYRRLLSLRPSYLVDTFNSAQDFLKSKNHYDIIFLDIEMPQINGIETAKQIRKKYKNTYIIFLTNHTEYMAEAFKVRAYRFLIKPINEAELVESIEQAELELLNSDKIMIQAHEKTFLMNTNDIVCIEAFGDSSIIYTTNGANESNKNLKYWSEKLPSEHFSRIHKSYLIAFKYVTVIEDNSVKMSHMNQSIPISRRKQSSFKKSFLDYIKKYSKYI
jgi:DNA-binding LytR/AlgR family response regulator